MPSLLWAGFEVFINLVEIAGSVYLAWCLLRGDSKAPFLSIPSCLFIFIGTLWLSVFLFVDAMDYLDIMPGILTFILYAVFVLRAKWYLGVLWSLVNMALLISTAYTVPTILGIVLNVPFGAFYTYDSVRLLSMPLAHILWVGMLAVIIRLYKPRQALYILRKSRWVFLSVPVFSLAFIIILMQYAFALKDESVSILLPALTGAGLMILNLGTLYLYNQMAKQEEEAVVLQAQNQLGVMALYHQEELRELTLETRRFRHDFNNHVQALQGMARMERHADLQAYLNDLAEEVGSFSDYIVTGNSVMDALLCGNTALARQKEITVTIDAAVPETLPVSDRDLCILMGNLFSNALDANMKVLNPEQRFIDLHMRAENANLIILIRNATDGSEKKRDGRFITTKEAGRHGFGLVSIDHIIKSYNGFCERLHQDRVFTTQIILPLAALPRRT